jgi:hypothetical protein
MVGNVDILHTNMKFRVFGECYNRNIIRIKHDRPFNKQMHLIHEHAEINDIPCSIALAPIFRMR